MKECYEPKYEAVSMKVRFCANKSSSKFLSMTDGKIYEVEGLTEVLDVNNNPIPAYMLVEDDRDVQESYEVGIFEVVE